MGAIWCCSMPVSLVFWMYRLWWRLIIISLPPSRSFHIPFILACLRGCLDVSESTCKRSCFFQQPSTRLPDYCIAQFLSLIHKSSSASRVIYFLLECISGVGRASCAVPHRWAETLTLSTVGEIRHLERICFSITVLLEYGMRMGVS